MRVIDIMNDDGAFGSLFIGSGSKIGAENVCDNTDDSSEPNGLSFISIFGLAVVFGLDSDLRCFRPKIGLNCQNGFIRRSFIPGISNLNFSEGGILVFRLRGGVIPPLKIRKFDLSFI